MKRLIFIAACAAVSFGAPAEAKEAPEASWPVIDARAYIDWPSPRLRAIRPGTDNTAIIELLGGRTYRARLYPGCRDAAFGGWSTIGVEALSGRFERGSFVNIDGRRCRVSALEELQDPAKAEQAAQTSPGE